MKTKILLISVLGLFVTAFLAGCKATTPTVSTTDPGTTATTAPETHEIVNGGFETGNLSGWTILSGNAFYRAGVTDDATIGTVPYGKEGTYLYGVYAEALVGKMKSSTFTIGGSGFLTFRMGAGYLTALTYLSVVDAETGLELARFGNTEYHETDYATDPAGYRVDNLVPYYADLSALLGRSVYLLAVDDSTANHGYLTLDAIQTYHEERPTTIGMFPAEDIKPAFPDAAGIPNVLANADFSAGTLEGWTVEGEAGSFRPSHLNASFRLSNRPDETKVGVLRSGAFKVGGTGLISFRLGATKNPLLTYLSVKKVGTNEEVFRTWSNRWKDADEENTHLYFIDLSRYMNECFYLELVDNSRADWGLITFEDLTTYYGELPHVHDEIAVNLQETIVTNPDFAEMRNEVNALIAGIGDATERTTFQKTFYATIDGVSNSAGTWGSVLAYNADGSTFCTTGDIVAMWLRDSSAQVLPYLQFMNGDEDVRLMVKGLLKKQFELIRRDPYANAFNANGSVFERKFEIDSLCYPIWLAFQYFEITGDASIFDAFFVMTVQTILDTFQAERHHSDATYAVTNGTDYANSSPAVNLDCGLIWSGYRPSDDVTYYKYNIPANMFAVTTLERIAFLLDALDLGPDLEAEAVLMASEVRIAIETYGIYDDPENGTIYVFETNGMNADSASSAGKLLGDMANIPSLLSAPWLGYCAQNDALYQNTRSFILSDANPWYHEGAYAKGIGDLHQVLSGNAVWPMAIAMQALTSSDDGEIGMCIDYMTATTAGTYVMHEAFNPDNPAQYTRNFFTWPCALYAYLYLNEILPAEPAT